MSCERAIELISALVDRELEADDRQWLQGHLRECGACQATLDAFTLQDHALRATFAPRRDAAASLASATVSRLPVPEPAPVPRGKAWARIAVAVGAAAALVGIILVANWWNNPSPIVPDSGNPDPIAQAEFGRLRPRARPETPPVETLEVGKSVQTNPGEKARYGLPDGSILYVNQQTEVQLESERSVQVKRGAVYVEVAAEGGEAKERFTIKTPSREVVALGTKFSVDVADVGTGVIVTQGRVQVSGVERTIEAGQVLPPGGDVPEPAPRTSHLLAWTSDLMNLGEAALVPASKHQGGSLIVVDANGQETKLSMRKYHVDVHIEDGFARTTIDQTYFNHHPWRLEGTFYFPLPADASLSRLAMYVNGELMEGGMTEREYGRNVYERIVNSQRDPALLEWVDGTTFKMRVFPLEGRQEKRIVLSYTQRLPSAYGKTTYRFPAGHSLQVVGEWSFHAQVNNGVAFSASSPSHPGMTVERQGNDIALDAQGKGVKVDRDVVVELLQTGPDAVAVDRPHFSRFTHEGSTYLMLRYRPDLPGKLARERRDWVILFESSGNRDPLLARTQIEIVRHLLGQAEHDDRFVILTAGSRVHLFKEDYVPATPENVNAALAFLERTHLIGALDLGQALEKASGFLKKGNNPHLVHLGSGLTKMGRRQDDLGKELPPGTRYIGVGVGKRWSRQSMKQWAERTGGFYTQINPDEPVAWRTFDLLAILNTPRLLDVTVSMDGQSSPRFLLHNVSIAQGEEVCAITRLEDAVAGGAGLPSTLKVLGKLDGQPFERRIRVEDVEDGAGYLPRTWARLEIERLLAENAAGNREKIVELSKAMYVMSPFTSLLVLENEEMYREFKVDRGRKDHWALYPCPAKIPVVYEPDPTMEVDVRNAPQGLKPAASQILQTILIRKAPRFLSSSQRGYDNNAVVTAFQIYRGAFAYPTTNLGRLFRTGDGFGFDSDRTSNLMVLTDGTQTERFGFDGGLVFNPAQGRENLNDLGRDMDFTVMAGARVAPIPDRVTGEVFFANGGEKFLHMDFDGLLPLAFSPDGRRLASGEREESARMWSMDRRELDLTMLDVDLPPRTLMSLESDELHFSRHGNFYSDFQLQGLHGNGVVAPLSLLTVDDSRNMPVLDAFIVPRTESLKRLSIRTGSTESLLLDRPRYSGDQRLFHDLVAHAPGLNTSGADVSAVLEAEAAPELNHTPGRVDPRAARLIEQARRGEWFTLTLERGKSHPPVEVMFNGKGQYAYDRVLPLGMKEQVICDGKSLWHLYPEIALGGKRKVSRFHRAEFLTLVPWVLPPASDLARGVDLEAIDDHTVALVPHAARDLKPVDGKPVRYLRVHLVFGEDGRFVRRELVEVPSGKVHRVESYDGKGNIIVTDDDGKELARQTLKVAPAEAPVLIPQTEGLVVLPLPYRNRQHVFPRLRLHPGQPLHAGENGCYRYLSREDSLELLATCLAERNSDDVRRIFQHCFVDHEDVHAGLFTILEASGIPATSEPAFHAFAARHQATPLVRYLALLTNSIYQHYQTRLPLHLGAAVGERGSFLVRMATFHDLLKRWQKRPGAIAGTVVRPGDLRDVIGFVKDNSDNVLSWALLKHVQHWEGQRTWKEAALVEGWKVLAGEEGSYLLRYEHAATLYHAERYEEARAHFEKLYTDAFNKGVLPQIDSTFVHALGRDGKDLWNEWMLQTASQLIEKKQYPAVVWLAWQCRKVDDQPLGDNLLTLALGSPGEEEEQLVTRLAALRYLQEVGEWVQADELAKGLLANEKYANAPTLHRLAYTIASNRGQQARAIGYLERALDLEARNLPEVINLQRWREDHRALLNHYQEQAQVFRSLSTGEESQQVIDRRIDDLLQRTIHVADRWRAYDPEVDQPCNLAAGILKVLGEEDLAWDYLTSRFATGEEHAYLESEGNTLSVQGHFELAERAFATEVEANPQNGILLWNRIANLRHAGQTQQAEALLKELAGMKDPNPSWITQRAEWQLER